METNEAREDLRQRLDDFGRRRRHLANAGLAYRVLSLTAGLGSAALLLLCGWTAQPLFNALAVLAVLVGLGALAAYLWRHWEPRRSLLGEAYRFEALAGELNSRVISAVDFLTWEQPTALTAAVVRQARQDLARPPASLLDPTPRNRWRVRCGVGLALFACLGLTERFGVGRLAATVQLCALDLRESVLPTRYALLPGPGPHLYRVGTAAEVGLRFTRFRYPAVTLERTRTDVPAAPTERLVLKVAVNGKAAVAMSPAAAGEYRCRLAFGRRLTEPFTVAFAKPPALENMELDLVYPAYTRLAPKRVTGTPAGVTAVAGTRQGLGFTFTKPLQAAALLFDDGTRLPLQITGRFANATRIHTAAARAELRVTDRHGWALEQPVSLDFALTPDDPPRLILPAFLKKNMPYTKDEFAGFTVAPRIEDDFGVAKCVLTWKKSSTDAPDKITATGAPIERAVLPPRPKALALFENVFADEAKTAEPGDLYAFCFEAFDTHTPQAQRTVSPEYSLFIQGEPPHVVRKDPEDRDAGGRGRKLPGEGVPWRPPRPPGQTEVVRPTPRQTIEDAADPAKTIRNTEVSRDPDVNRHGRGPVSNEVPGTRPPKAEDVW